MTTSSGEKHDFPIKMEAECSFEILVTFPDCSVTLQKITL
jgi:hypothetical protein